jgi:hypothetical protein
MRITLASRCQVSRQGVTHSVPVLFRADDLLLDMKLNSRRYEPSRRTLLSSWSSM